MQIRSALLIAATSLIAFGTTHAQISFDQEEATTSVSDSQDDIKIDLVLSNPGGAATFVWERTEIRLTDDYTGSAVCDVNQCYLPDVSTAEFDMPGDGATSPMIVHVYRDPGTPISTAEVMVIVYEKNNQRNRDTATYFFESVNSTRKATVPTVGIFPNPAQAEVTLQGAPLTATRVSVYDAVGREVITRAFNGNSLNVADLASGAYTLRLFDDSHQVLAQSKLIRE